MRRKMLMACLLALCLDAGRVQELEAGEVDDFVDGLVIPKGLQYGFDQACETLKTMANAGLEGTFESLVDPEIAATVPDMPWIDMPADLPRKPPGWDCMLMPEHFDTACTVAAIRKPGPARMKAVENQLVNLLQQCLDPKPLGTKKNTGNPVRNGLAFRVNGKVNAYIHSRPLEDDDPEMRVFTISFSVM